MRFSIDVIGQLKGNMVRNGIQSFFCFILVLKESVIRIFGHFSHFRHYTHTFTEQFIDGLIYSTQFSFVSIVTRKIAWAENQPKTAFWWCSKCIMIYLVPVCLFLSFSFFTCSCKNSLFVYEHNSCLVVHIHTQHTLDTKRERERDIHMYNNITTPTQPISKMILHDLAAREQMPKKL